MQQYTEVRCIGRGSYGSAHLVTECTTNQRFVIKKIPMELLSDSEKQQSFREVELLAKLKHPNVVEYKESFVEGNVIHIVMAYCDGGDLAGRIKERAAIVANGGHGYFDIRQILDWFVQMAMAIKYLHEQRILHRDLKTSNIFLTTENVIKLGDFGIAKTLESTLDQAKTVVGTPYYMSPEVCESKPYSYASDVWSLGCVLYEMIALKHAFDAPNILTLILKIVQNDFAAVPAHYDPEVSDILKGLLDKRPDHRPTMDQIFMMPYIRNHMQALVESGGSLRMGNVARRPHGTPKRRVHAKNGRRSSSETGPRPPRRGIANMPQNRWAAVTPNDREEVLMGETSDLELLDASQVMDESSLDIRLPERSKTPEPLVLGLSDELSPGRSCFKLDETVAVRPSPMRKRDFIQNGTVLMWSEQSVQEASLEAVRRRPSSDEVEEELDTRFQSEAAEAFMNPNFQRVYAEECDDSLTVKYAPTTRNRSRESRGGANTMSQQRPSGSDIGKPPKPEVSIRVSRYRVSDKNWQVTPSYPYLDTPLGSSVCRSPNRMHQRAIAPRRRGRTEPSLMLTLQLEESSSHGSEKLGASNEISSLSDSGILRQLELEEESSDEENEDGYSSNSEGYEGEENFYSEHSAYSDDSDFVDEENETEYSDDFEELDGEVIEYANEEFVPEDEPGGMLVKPSHSSTNRSDGTSVPEGSFVAPSFRPTGVKSPNPANSPAARRTQREVQWVMRNVAQNLMESCDNLSVAYNN